MGGTTSGFDFGSGEMLLLGSATSAIGSIANGYQSDATAKFNARQAEQQAQIAVRQAQIEESNFRYNVQKLLGSQRASAGASGVTYSGSVRDVHESSVVQAERDAFRIKYQGILNKNNLLTKAALARLSGASAVTSGYIGAASSFAGMAARLAAADIKQATVQANAYPGTMYYDSDLGTVSYGEYTGTDYYDDIWGF